MHIISRKPKIRRRCHRLSSKNSEERLGMLKSSQLPVLSEKGKAMTVGFNMASSSKGSLHEQRSSKYINVPWAKPVVVIKGVIIHLEITEELVLEEYQSRKPVISVQKRHRQSKKSRTFIYRVVAIERILGRPIQPCVPIYTDQISISEHHSTAVKHQCSVSVSSVIKSSIIRVIFVVAWPSFVTNGMNRRRWRPQSSL